MGGRNANPHQLQSRGRCLQAMKLLLKILATYLSITIVLSCQTQPKFDNSILERAQKIVAETDSSSINAFLRWNYLGTYKGKEWWSKNAGDTSKYILLYTRSDDSSKIGLLHSKDFQIDFPCKFYFDTSRYKEFEFALYKGFVCRISNIDSVRESNIQSTHIKVNELFPTSNPFDTLAILSKLKDRFNVMSIEYTNEYSPSLDFFLERNYRLTYMLNEGSLRKSLTAANKHDSINLNRNWTLYRPINMTN